jgi:hypothetical protein
VHPAELLRKVEVDGFAVVSSCLSEETVQRLASASAIAASLVSAVTSTSGNRSAAVPISVKFAVVSLIFSIVASVFTIIALSRGYDRARAFFKRSQEQRIRSRTGRIERHGVEVDFGVCLCWANRISCGFFIYRPHCVSELREARLERVRDAPRCCALPSPAGFFSRCRNSESEFTVKFPRGRLQSPESERKPV